SDAAAAVRRRACRRRVADRRRGRAALPALRPASCAQGDRSLLVPRAREGEARLPRLSAGGLRGGAPAVRRAAGARRRAATAGSPRAGAGGVIRRAMVLAAGRGRRLAPRTDTLPKPLLPIAGRPLLEHILEFLRTGGIEDVVVNLHHLGH